jgi:CO/xanthine dehydrogenase Mo-binding subunit/aerobic-type carbon monoxide dehydrogenase small subunit (CoxS/CutS family)
MTQSISLNVNGNTLTVDAEPAARLSTVLRNELGLEGTKIGCDAGDCGACTVIMNGEAVCACMVAAGQADGARIVTIEGVAAHTASGQKLQHSFRNHGAAQCGICTPGMIMSAAALLDQTPAPDDAAIEAALGGMLCRCTGYRKIIDAVKAAATKSVPSVGALPLSGAAVGASIARLDGQPKVDGTEAYGADAIPKDALWVRAVRAPFHHATFTLGDLAAYAKSVPGIVRILTASDVPGRNLYGVLPAFADQPVFAEGETRHRGEAIAAVVGERAAVEALDLSAFPVTWAERPAHLTIDSALAGDASLLHTKRPGNVLVRGKVLKGDPAAAFTRCAAVVSGTFETGFVEHAYIEPEAGWAQRVGHRIEITASTQAPYLDRDDTAQILGLPPEDVRIIPAACGGGFGSKLDLSVQPFIALAAWLTNRPCAMVYSRPESIAATTKRHPSRLTARIGAGPDGKLLAMEVDGDFNTGAYASWGPTVANRVPVHASGPYFIPNYRAESRAILTHCVPAGAFRGFGVPQAVIAQEQLFDELAQKLGLDPLEFRIRNALTAEQPTVTGQIMGDGVGFRQCLEALRPRWRIARAEAEAFNENHARQKRGVGVAGMFYGCGNTSLANPSTIRIGLKPDGRVALHQGAVDIGQGSNTVMTQIAADALGLPVDLFDLVSADTDLTPDCGKTSASRQTFVTGKAAEQAARVLRSAILLRLNAGDDAELQVAHGKVSGGSASIALASLAPDALGYLFSAEETFDPPTTPLNANGQGNPYAVYGFGAHIAEVEVDTMLGTVRVLRVTAAHDVGRAINPQLLEGQVEGGVAQGIGLALMEEFTPGRGENLHDYLIPTIGDVPPIETILIEDPSSVGPFGAKGIGEQALIPTAPAIYNAIHQATGVRVHRAPATPDRLRAAILALDTSS